MASTFLGDQCSTEDSKDCHQTLYWCSQCESVLCETCWDLQVAPRVVTASRARAKKKKHERTELEIADYILEILEPTLDKDEVMKSHVSNVDSRWFGVEINNKHATQVSLKSKSFLEFASGSETNPALQYPCLVSFVGETGAGKSTLINAMMKSVGATQIEQITPVIGSQIDSPTSGDVHLFPDPKSLNSARPIFFADCEGFGGGNRAPLCARTKESYKKFKLIHYPHRMKTRKRKIVTAELYTRQGAVEALYPRILFTFSDVVCLVSKNFRKIENHIVNLLTWADNVFERSLNQPMLPIALIVVNGLEGQESFTCDWWDVEAVTNEQLKNHQDRINLYCEPLGPRLPAFARQPSNGTVPRTIITPDVVAKLTHQWRNERKKTINTLKDLILCYYSDFKIICIPSANDPPHIIHTQYTKLRDLIAKGARDSENARKLAGLLMTGEDLDYYLEKGFDHFSSSKLPFNFLQAAVQAKPVSNKFADHLLRTAITLLSKKPNDDGKLLLEKLAPIFASSIFLDAIRKRIPYKGNAILIFEKYREQCRIAQRELYQKYWPCEAKDRHGRRCANHLNGHSKGHQDHKGKVFTAGGFWTKHIIDSRELIEFFSKQTSTQLQKIFDDWEAKLPAINGLKEEKYAALVLHLGRTSTLYDHSGADTSLRAASHTTCFCCLISTPLHPLFCGHVICQECLESLAKNGQDDFELSRCPRHNDREWTPPWRTSINPPTVGLRILSLDGGGVRSIVQLIILQELEKLIGLGVNIVDFFDLIIGTSGGGIVAASLGIKKFPIAECIEKFRQVSQQAFIKRPGVGGIFGTLIEAQYHSRYKSANLAEALQNTFGEKTLIFGGQRDPTSEETTRVGVSTTTSTGRAILLANYQRSALTYSVVGRPGYCFYRGETAEEELKVWEALRATSAAPRYFKSYYHKASGHAFDDGGIKYNNPVVLANTERKIIWPEQKERDPDILLSIGTLWCDEDKSSSKDMDESSSKARFGLHRYARKVFNIAANAIEDDLDCEKTWSNFYESLNIAEEEGYRKKKYCRLNPKTSNAPPALDSVSSLHELQETARHYCSTSPEVKNAASTLIASLFYFELKNAKEDKSRQGWWTCEGER
ncbi:FabD/lysophospholipase-like protein [Choiromyces venosus 120613-1]|uniref:FabD/lysophospholipase-like protein n=1 Tax=Choiromyces venosus 120613-1 TaxID=1336337 RepID=A0A3N4JC12_9PEZI|nr:FabD/lysophospholipase-like protein [Choiromyces venosus 120613-1]